MDKSKSKTDKQKVGEVGENVACRFLVKQGFEVIERNYWKKWGEIDVIVKKDSILHFIEVKTVSCENLDSVTHETDAYKPEDNVHPWKLKRLSRTIQTYLLEKVSDDPDWQFDIIAIYLDMKSKKAKISFLEDIVI
ncbi:MAG: YraN family protein [Candidatus Paceibacteria bacterium]